MICILRTPTQRKHLQLDTDKQTKRMVYGIFMITYLNVSFCQQDEAKALGPQWSPTSRKWFIIDIDNIEPFMKWVPEHLKQPCKPVTK